MKCVMYLSYFLMSLILFLSSCENLDETDSSVTVKASNLEVSFPENPAMGYEIGTIPVMSSGGKVHYQFIQQLPDGAFAINDSTGLVTVASPSLFDYELNPSLTASILVENENISDTATIIVNLIDVAEINATDFITTISENPANGQSLGFIVTNFSVDSVTFAIFSQSPQAAMEINSFTGEITVNDSSLFDFDIRTVLTAKAKITHINSQNSDTINIQINLVEDVNEPFIIVANVSKNISHPSMSGSDVVLLGSNEISIQTNIATPLTYTIVAQSHANAFKINVPTNGSIYSNDKSVYDYHQSMIATVEISGSGISTQFTVTFFVVHPTDNIQISINDFIGSVNENPPFQNFTIGQLSGEVTGTNIVQYKIVEQSPSLLSPLIGIGLLNRHFITGPGFAQIDFETISQITGKVEVAAYAFSVSSGFVKKDTVNFTINVNDVFEAIVVANGFETTIPENPNNGQILGTISASTDTGSIVYSLANSNPVGAFSIDSITGVVTVADSSLFDFEQHTELHADVDVSVQSVVKSAHITVFLTNEIDAVQERLDNGETPLQIYNSDNNLLGEIHGSYYQGGYIAHLNKQAGSGLIVFPQSFGETMTWGCDSMLTEALGIGIGAGKINTNIILNSSCGDSVSPAIHTTNLIWQGYSDWHLPSNNELLAIYLHVHSKGLGNFGGASYWSSTEVNQFNAYEYSFNTGGVATPTLKTNLRSFRPVRYFSEPPQGSKRYK